jgi:hypothetical protein
VVKDLEVGDFEFSVALMTGDLKNEGNGKYTLPIYSFINTEDLKVTVEKKGYDFSPDNLTVQIYYYAPSTSNLQELLAAVTKLGPGEELKVEVDGSNITLAIAKQALGLVQVDPPAKITLDLLEAIYELDDDVLGGLDALAGVIIRNKDITVVTDAEPFKGSANIERVVLNGPSDGSFSDVFAGTTLTNLKTVVIGDDVEAVDAAFTGCTELASVTLGKKVVSIEAEAFKDSIIKSIFIPKSVTEIGASAFEGTVTDGYSPLASIVFEGGWEDTLAIDDKAFASAAITTLTLPPGDYAFSGTTGTDSPFDGCHKLKTVIVNGEVTDTNSVGIFAGLDVTTVIIGNDVEEIPENMFADCVLSDVFSFPASITSITYGNSLETIGASAFKGAAVTSIALPNNVTDIGASAFEGCEKVTSITLGNNLSEIGDKAFAGTKITSITLPAGSYTMTGTNTTSAFAGCDKLKTVIMNGPAAGTPAFSGTGTGASRGLDITSVTVGNGVQVAADAFKFCLELQSVSLGLGVTGIGANAFEGCAKLASISIPITVSTVGASAFEGCIKLVSITLPNALTTLDTAVFRGCSILETVNIGSGSSLAAIPANAFENCAKMVAVVLPKTVTSIGSEAFKGCGALASLTVNGIFGEESIGENAFENCGKLETLILNASPSDDPDTANDFEAFPVTVKNVTIGEGVTPRADYFTTIVDGGTLTLNGPATGTAAFAGKGFKTIVFGPKVTAIAEEAFDGCDKLESVTIPNTILTVNASAFNSCTSLKNVTIEEGLKPQGSVTNADKAGFTILQNSAFAGCIALQELVLPANVITINADAFNITSGQFKTLTVNGALTAGFTGTVASTLVNLTINGSPAAAVALPTSVTTLSVGKGVVLADGNISTMASIATLELNAPASGAYTLFDAKTTIATVKLGADFGGTLTGASFAGSAATLKEITVTAGNAAYSAADGVLYNAARTTLIKYPPKRVGVFAIPSSVNTIGVKAFVGCEVSNPFPNLTIGENVVIQAGAFSGVDTIYTLTLGNNVNVQASTADGGAFEGCAGLAYATIGNNVRIADNGFKSCGALTSVELGTGVNIVAGTSFPPDATVPAGSVSLKAVYDRMADPVGGAGVYVKTTSGSAQKWAKQ